MIYKYINNIIFKIFNFNFILSYAEIIKFKTKKNTQIYHEYVQRILSNIKIKKVNPIKNHEA